MTSNIDKLNLIAPLLVGREIHWYFFDETGQTMADGQFHSLEIDDVYPDSKPMAYFRATNIVRKRMEGFPVYDAVEAWKYEEDGAEFVFPVDDLLCIELKQSNEYERKDLITIEFAREGATYGGDNYVMFFSYWGVQD